MNKGWLIFDLDGTISDPFVGISRSINYAFESLSLASVDPERIRPLIGPPLTEIFSHFLGEVPETQMRELVAAYRERYATIGYRENRLYDRMHDVILELAGVGFRMGVCTSKRADYAGRIVEMFGLADCFSFISGGDVGIQKRQQLARLIDDKTIAGTAIMIGDRDIDISAARQNALGSVGVLWGFGERDEIEAAAPDHILTVPDELLHCFR